MANLVAIASTVCPPLYVVPEDASEGSASQPLSPCVVHPDTNSCNSGSTVAPPGLSPLSHNNAAVAALGAVAAVAPRVAVHCDTNSDWGSTAPCPGASSAEYGSATSTRSSGGTPYMFKRRRSSSGKTY